MSADGKLRSVNPATGELIDEWNSHSAEEVIRIIREVDWAYESWKSTSFSERATCLRKTGRILEDKKEKYAELMALEMGKPLLQGISEAEKCACVCDYYAEKGEEYLAPNEVITDAKKSYTCYTPLGVIYAVMPWNFPFWQVMRFAAPVVMAGNGILLKHSPNVTGCVLALEKLFRDAGFPDNLFRAVLVSADAVPAMSDMIIGRDEIKGVTLTGSTAAGRAVASCAGSNIKKSVLELGGSDPAIILSDADLKHAAKSSLFSRLVNSGQNCIASKRFIVMEDVLDEFIEHLLREAEERRVGDPFEQGVTVGPMARYDLRDELHRQVEKSVELGAELLAGGYIPDSPGAFYPITVLTGVVKGMPVYDEETFGPVAAVISAKDEKEAVSIANDTRFGLAASIYTADTDRGERIVLGLAAGACFVNTFERSDPRLPFGGIGISGYGRELSREGIMEFVNLRTIYINEHPVDSGQKKEGNCV